MSCAENMVLLNRPFAARMFMSFAFAAIVLSAVTIIALYSTMTNSGGAAYEVVVLPRWPGESQVPLLAPHAMYCVVAWDSGGNPVQLQRLWTGGASICVATNSTGGKQFVYSSVGTYSRVFSVYNLMCNNGTNTCLSATGSCDDGNAQVRLVARAAWCFVCARFVTQCPCAQNLFKTYLAARMSANQSATDPTGTYNVTWGGLDPLMWGQVCLASCVGSAESDTPDCGWCACACGRPNAGQMCQISLHRVTFAGIILAITVATVGELVVRHYGRDGPRGPPLQSV